MTDWEDTELIECAKCKAVLNGKSLRVRLDDENQPETICETCYGPPHPIESMLFADPLTAAMNKAGNEYVKNTQHVDLTETDNAEVMIRNMRFMAFGAGFLEGAKWKPKS